jgi:hypothetical protein
MGSFTSPIESVILFTITIILRNQTLEVFLHSSLTFKSISVATLALGSRPKQKGYKVEGQEEA